jgi:hypothetical protein
MKPQENSLRGNPPTLMTQGEAAAFAGLSKEQVRGAIATGTLPFVDYEDRRFIRHWDLQAFIEAIAQMTRRVAR